MRSTYNCRSCVSGPLLRFLELGDVPPVNAFLEPHEILKEKAFPLNLAICKQCYLVQLEKIVPPDQLFTNYLHLSSASPSNIKHLEEVAQLIFKRFAPSDKTKILEIGSNDGTLLAMFKSATDQLLGVDPAQNLVEMSKKRGVETWPSFFGTKTAEDVLKAKGAFDIVIGLNVIPHTPNVIDLLKGIAAVLTPTGTLIMEGAYALDTILRGEFDTVYHEHVFCFSLHALISTFDRAGLKVVDVEKIPTQGGSLRVFAQRHEKAGTPSKNVTNLLHEEEKLNLTKLDTYMQVGPKALEFKNKFIALLNEEKKKSGKLIGLGAPARGVVIMNYCGLGPDQLDFLIDDTPLKQGRVSPGTHVPVKSWDALSKERQWGFVLFSWNYKDHLLSKLKSLGIKGRVIVPFPELMVQSIG